jgi:hypothetical protein
VQRCVAAANLQSQQQQQQQQATHSMCEAGELQSSSFTTLKSQPNNARCSGVLLLPTCASQQQQVIQKHNEHSKTAELLCRAAAANLQLSTSHAEDMCTMLRSHARLMQAQQKIHIQLSTSTLAARGVSHAQQAGCHRHMPPVLKTPRCMFAAVLPLCSHV